MPAWPLSLFRSAASRALDVVYDTHLVIALDMEGRVLDANPTFLALFGYTLEEVRGQEHAMFLPRGEAGGEAHRSFWAALRAGRHQTGIFHRITKDGRDVWLQASCCPVRGAGGEVVRVLNFAQDVTESRMALADSSGQIAAINRSQAVIEFDTAGNILAANQNFLDTMGYRAEEIVGRHHRIFLDPQEVTRPAYAEFWKALARGQFQMAEFRRLAKGGREVWIQASYNPILDPQGQVWKIVKYATDVTSKVRDRDRRMELGRAVDGELGGVSSAVSTTSQRASSAVEADRKSVV